MPNGHDKNFQRLLMACAAYWQKYGEWPSQARMHPVVLHNLADLLDHENFERLASHLELRTCEEMAISVGGRGVVDYKDVSHGTLGDGPRQAKRWLGVEVRPDRL
jgi:hypothetical protein